MQKWGRPTNTPDIKLGLARFVSPDVKPRLAGVCQNNTGNAKVAQADLHSDVTLGPAGVPQIYKMNPKMTQAG